VTVQVDRVDARSVGRWFAADPDLGLPTRPRLVPELLVLPLDDDGLLVVGAEEPQVLRGRSARGLLMRLLPLLDGSRTLTDISARLPGLDPAIVRDVVGLLFSRGLLEDGGAGEAVPEPLADVASFLGRHIDASRRFPNRVAALRALQEARVVVVGPADLAASLVAELSACGVAEVQLGDRDDPGHATGLDRHVSLVPDRATVTIVVSTGTESAVTADHRPAPREQTLLVRLGSGEAHLGPHLIEGVTACPACVARVHPHPPGEPDPLRARLWIGLAAHLAFLILTKLPPGPSLRGFRVQRYEPGGLREETRTAVRLPGCVPCGLSGEALESGHAWVSGEAWVSGGAWPPDDPRMLAWIYHCTTSLPSRDMLSPKDHQAHYAAEFTRLATQERRLLWTATSAVAPSPATTAPDAYRPQGRQSSGSGGELDATTLAKLLSGTAGEVTEGGRRRRLVPTGGNLGSVVCWVIARRVPGLTPGAYLYDARRQSLELLCTVADEDLRTALHTDRSLPDCVVIGTGALATCAQKYRAFAYRLIQFDAGVALAYLHLHARPLGLGVREYPDVDLDVTRVFGVPPRWEFPLPTFAVGLGGEGIGPGSTPGSPIGRSERVPGITAADYSVDVLPTLLTRLLDSPPPPRPVEADEPSPEVPETGLRDLEQAVRGRRAIRQFRPAGVPSDALRRVIAGALAARSRRVAAGAPACFVRPVIGVGVAGDGVGAGLYEVDPTTVALSKRGEFGPEQAYACTNQASLALAPITVFMIGDLPRAVGRRGLRGYAELAVHAGAMAGEAWLTATATGLVGTAAGGVVAGGLRAAAGMDGFRECPLLALHLGLPRRPESEG
jgi:SagB-type dehydrogenase family enzyme